MADALFSEVGVGGEGGDEAIDQKNDAGGDPVNDSSFLHV